MNNGGITFSLSINKWVLEGLNTRMLQVHRLHRALPSTWLLRVAIICPLFASGTDWKAWSPREPRSWRPSGEFVCYIWSKMTFHFLQNYLFREGEGGMNTREQMESSLAWNAHIVLYVSVAAWKQSDPYMRQYMHTVSSHICIKIVVLMAVVHLQAPGGTHESQRQERL